MAMQKWHEAWAREALRVLKPGGHLLAFGGTRTYHRLACAIEDAGFEIRDSLLWLYGSGFPKSLDVSKAVDGIDAPNANQASALEFTAWLRTTGVTAAQVNEATSTFMASHYLTAKSQPQIPTAEHWALIRPLLKVEVPEWVDVMIGVRAVSENLAQREVVGERDGTLLAVAPGAGTERPDVVLEITDPYTPEAADWRGWGTALKPGHEPIVVARKPLDGTVARNVLRHGTGALNVDGCRIDTGGEVVTTPQSNPDNRQGVVGGELQAPSDIERNQQAQRESVERTNELGRWPANVVLSHADGCRQVGTRRVLGHAGYPNGPGGKSMHYASDKTSSEVRPDGWVGHADADGMETVEEWDCVPGCPVRELDAQSGVVGAAAPVAGTEPSSVTADIYGARERVPGAFHGDTGGASRFFYCAKASGAERNAGLGGFVSQEVHRYGAGIGGGEDSRLVGAADRNIHPTVKPIDLMRWLVRLVTPPGGLVLDPFTGSGTTGAAAILEGFEFVGVEREGEYAEIARARIEFWTQHPTDMPIEKALASERDRGKARDRGQLGLFG